MRKPELLIPAGNLEKLRTALLYGADAVYVGAEGLSLRASSSEMSLADLAAGVKEAHAKDVKVYAAANTFARNSDLDKAKIIIPELAATGIDALIVSEPGMLRLMRNSAPHLPVHLSTQANTTNIESVKFWKDQGVQRIILARELNLKEIGEIAAAVPDMELEIFVHGAMCMAYSGRCYLSAFRNRRSANEGDCSQPCRWEYALHESTRPYDPLILQEDERYSYLLSSKDLCLIEYLPEVLASGVTSLKIEGRMKSAYYVAVVTRAYRQALDDLIKQKEKYQCRQEWIDELGTTSNRGYTTGFAFAEEKINETNPGIKYVQTHEPAGIVLRYDPVKKRMLIGIRNHIVAGSRLELLLPDKTVSIDTRILRNEDGQSLTEANNDQRIYLPVEKEVPVGAILRQKAK
ncbi:MAG: U32 family peptidase [Deltaproteobacteria bacterium]|nr:U32 family peptidase [Deltaproteobacteria bacterium]